MGKTGFSLSVDGNNAFDSRTIRAQSPGDETVTGLAKNTTDGLNARFRIDHAIGQGGQLRAEYERRSTDRGNLGVGDFDLPERAYDTGQVNDTFRVRNTRVLGKKVFSELRFEFTSSDLDTLPLSALPTVRVNEAFTAGGAGQSGSRSTREIELAQNFDFTIRRKHAMRAGVLFETAWVTSTQQQNGNGTYVFQSLDAFNLGQPDTYTLRVGDPLVDYSQIRAGWFLQDDVRVGRNLSVSVGVRQEIQTQVSDAWNLAPRAAFTWTANRRTTVRGGYGIFYDWYDTNLYEQTLRVDGVRQYDVIVENPSFPVIAGGGTRLPSSVIRAGVARPAADPAGLHRPRADDTPWAGLRMDYMWTRGSNTLRSVNVNAPVGRRATRSGAGNISEIQSSGRRASDRLTVGINARHERLRMFTNVMYQLPELAQLRGLGDEPACRQHEPRRRLGALGAGHPSPAVLHVQRADLEGHPRRPQHAGGLGRAVQHHHRPRRQPRYGVQRPAGRHGRNSARGANTVNATLRLNKSFGFGGRASGPRPAAECRCRPLGAAPRAAR